jgi:hypothetical protein
MMNESFQPSEICIIKGVVDTCHTGSTLVSDGRHSNMRDDCKKASLVTSILNILY